MLLNEKVFVHRRLQSHLFLSIHDDYGVESTHLCDWPAPAEIILIDRFVDFDDFPVFFSNICSL